MIITRIAPSPTGKFHIGTARTALFNYLFARANQGKFLIRLEDTDKERSKSEFTQDIIEGLEALGLVHDGEIFVQSTRVARHTELLQKLIAEGKAFVSKEEAKDGSGRVVEVVRLRNPNKPITFTDEVRGEITTDVTDLGDFVIARNINDPLYHFAVVADDWDMGVTHVIRGDDHISNTPRQIAIQEALGAPRPVYVHLPLIHSPQGGKLSKRKNAVAVNEFLTSMGYEPEALINFIAFMGWNPKTDQEIFSLQQLCNAFAIAGIQKHEAIWNEQKLNWFNKEWRRKKGENLQYREVVLENIKKTIANASVPDASISLATQECMYNDSMERHNTNAELYKAIQDGEYNYLLSEVPLNYHAPLLISKKSSAAEAKEHLQNILTQLERTSFAEAHDVIWRYAEEKGKGNVLWPLRVALSGRDKSMDPFVIAQAIGDALVRERIANAIHKLQ